MEQVPSANRPTLPKRPLAARKPIPVNPPRPPSNFVDEDGEQDTTTYFEPWSANFPAMPPTFEFAPTNQEPAECDRNQPAQVSSYPPPIPPKHAPLPAQKYLRSIASSDFAKRGPPDPYVGSSAVIGLKQKTFEKFIRGLDAAFVLFYNPCDKNCEAKVSVRQAAHTTQRENHGYGAVDCSQETTLCRQEQVSSMPTMKLYARGLTVDTYTHMPLLSREIRTYVEKAPIVREHVLEKKRCTIQ